MRKRNKAADYAWWLLNKESINTRRRAKYAECHESERIRKRLYYIKHTAKLLKRCRDYRFSNRQKRNAAMRLKIRTNVQFRLRMNIARRVLGALKRNSKLARTQQLVGCNFSFLRSWIQQKFKPGMAWNNYGEWHIDHIIPCAAFDLSRLEQQRQCFHYTNLQPLWAADNFEKGARFNHFPQATANSSESEQNEEETALDALANEAV